MNDESNFASTHTFTKMLTIFDEIYNRFKVKKIFKDIEFSDSNNTRQPTLAAIADPDVLTDRMSADYLPQRAYIPTVLPPPTRGHLTILRYRPDSDDAPDL